MPPILPRICTQATRTHALLLAQFIPQASTWGGGEQPAPSSTGPPPPPVEQQKQQAAQLMAVAHAVFAHGVRLPRLQTALHVSGVFVYG